jgi:hypothetical protein
MCWAGASVAGASEPGASEEVRAQRLGKSGEVRSPAMRSGTHGSRGAAGAWQPMAIRRIRKRRPRFRGLSKCRGCVETWHN